MEKKKLLCTILKYSFSFFTGVSILVMVLCVEFGFGFYNPATVKKSIISSGYVRKITDDMIGQVNELVEDSGIPKCVGDKLIDYEKMYITVNNGIERGLTGQGIGNTIDDTERFKEEFQRGVKAYLQEQNVEVDEEIDKTVETLSEQVTSTYRKYAKSKMALKYFNYIKVMKKRLLITAIICFFVLIISVIALFCLNKYRHRAIRGITYGAIAALLCNIIGQIYVYSAYHSMHKMNFHVYYADFLQEYMGKSMTIWYTINVALSLCVVGFLITIKKLKES